MNTNTISNQTSFRVVGENNQQLSPRWVMSQHPDFSRYNVVELPSYVNNIQTAPGEVTIPGSAEHYQQLGRALALLQYYEIATRKPGSVILRNKVIDRPICVRRTVDDQWTTNFARENAVADENGELHSKFFVREVHPITQKCQRVNSYRRAPVQTVNKYTLLAFLLTDGLTLNITAKSSRAATIHVMKGYRLELARLVGHNNRKYVSNWR